MIVFLKFLAEIISNVFTSLITTPKAKSKSVEGSVEIDHSSFTRDSLLKQHGWLLDRTEREDRLRRSR